MGRLGCILVVDDDPLSNYITERVIRGLGASSTVTNATDGLRALEYIKHQCECEDDDMFCPDVIILDINMPMMNGGEFLEHFHELHLHTDKKVGIIILSNVPVRDSDKEKFKKFNIIGYEVKPLTSEKLTKLLDHYFELAEK